MNYDANGAIVWLLDFIVDCLYAEPHKVSTLGHSDLPRFIARTALFNCNQAWPVQSIRHRKQRLANTFSL